MTTDQALETIKTLMIEHDKRHDREITNCYRTQDACREKFKDLFVAVEDAGKVDVEHKSKINGLSKKEENQDTAIEKLNKKFDEFRVWLGRWLIGLFTTFAVMLIGWIITLLITRGGAPL